MSKEQPTFSGTLLATIFCAAALYYTLPWIYSRAFWVVPVIFGLAVVLKTLSLCIFILRAIPQAWIYSRVFRKKGLGGTAGWASEKEVRKAGLYNPKGFFAGRHNKRKVFVEIECSGLVLAPAGEGKTTCFVIPALCHAVMSMIVPDLKGTLAVMTAKMRRRKFGHKTHILNPGRVHAKKGEKFARYNPLIILIEAWRDARRHRDLMPDTAALAKQILPEPPQPGENQFWRNGSRKFLRFVFLYLVTMVEQPAGSKDDVATLPAAFTLLSDKAKLMASLEAARTSTILNGDLASLANDILLKLEEGDPRQIESFREGAIQAVDVFAPSGALAESVSGTDFRFGELKRKKGTVYVVADPTRIEVYKPWVGLVMWCAFTELMRSRHRKPVCVLCDEATNFRIDGLPRLLTLAREFKIILWLIIQELEEWSHAYGRESLETLLSQTEAKLIFGVRSQTTAKLVSDMLGEASVKVVNHNIGSSFFDPVTRSVHETSRKILTEDEVRRAEQAILLPGDGRAVQVQRLPYFRVWCWKWAAAPNPLGRHTI
ncbi:MAG: type IV secretory system conjugative DNA transfer family protein [Pseudomonadota bacterium]